MRVVSAIAISVTPTIACGSQWRQPFFAAPPIHGVAASAAPLTPSKTRFAFIGITRLAPVS